MSETANKDWIFSFVTKYLPRLPDEVLIQVFDLLTFAHLVQCFIYLKGNVRDLLIRHYYSRKVNYIFSDIPVRYVKTWRAQLRSERLVTCVNQNELDQFHKALPDLIPQTLVLFCYQNFKKVKTMLKSFSDTISKVSELEIILDDCQITSKEFYNLLSWPNLSKLQLLCMQKQFQLRPSDADHELLKSHPKLKELFIRSHYINDWSKIELPPQLLRVNVSANPEIKFSTLKMPSNLQFLNLNYCGISDLKQLRNLKILPDSLTELILTKNKIQNLTLDDLPNNLRKLDLTQNPIWVIKSSDSEKTWPSNLSELILERNIMTDQSLVRINDGVLWPTNLKKLNLSTNAFRSINYLELPQSLEELKLSQNPFIWEKDQPVFEFPDNLKELHLSFCNIDSLEYFKFPKSLKHLVLEGNKIKDVSSYDDWSSLVNLNGLTLFTNSITSVENWEIPPNLSMLSLGDNPIKKISSKFPLFSPNYNYRLDRLDLEHCDLTNWKINYIPASLKILNLKRNKFPHKFVFHPCMKSLNQLDLGFNELTAIEFTPSDNKCYLNCVNLLGNSIEVDDLDEFYNNLESNLGKLKERDDDVNCVQEFERSTSDLKETYWDYDGYLDRNQGGYFALVPAIYLG